MGLLTLNELAGLGDWRDWLARSSPVLKTYDRAKWLVATKKYRKKATPEQEQAAAAERARTRAWIAEERLRRGRPGYTPAPKTRAQQRFQASFMVAHGRPPSQSEYPSAKYPYGRYLLSSGEAAQRVRQRSASRIASSDRAKKAPLTLEKEARAMAALLPKRTSTTPTTLQRTITSYRTPTPRGGLVTAQRPWQPATATRIAI